MAESRMGEEEGHGNLKLEMTKEVRKNVNVTLPVPHVHSFGTNDLTTRDRPHRALTELCFANNHCGTRSGWEAGDAAGKGRGKGGSRPRNRMGGRDRDGDQDQDESTGVQTIAIV